MKKLIVIAISLITISACTKKSTTTTPSTPPSTPKSTFNITFNGKTYNLVSTTTIPITAVTAATTSTSTGWVCSAGGSDKHIQCSMGGAKFDNPSSAIGSYKGGCDGAGTTYSLITLTDYDDGTKMYATDCTGKDTASRINITLSNASQVKGTFNVILSYNGVYYPATGNFDYLK